MTRVECLVLSETQCRCSR